MSNVNFAIPEPCLIHLTMKVRTATCAGAQAAKVAATQSRALIAQLMGDIITVDSTVTEEYQADYEILTANYTIPAHDGSESQTGDAHI